MRCYCHKCDGYDKSCDLPVALPLHARDWSGGASKRDKEETPEQKAKRLKVPLIPKLPEIPKDHNPVVSVCGECGMEIRRLMYYSCQRDRCPVQPKAML